MNNFPTREAAPPSAIRGRDEDYSKLQQSDRDLIDEILSGSWPESTTIVAETFIRRYHGDLYTGVK